MVCCAAACEQRALRAHNFAFTEDGCGALRKVVRLHMAEHSAHICLTSDAVSAFMRAQRHEMTSYMMMSPCARSFPISSLYTLAMLRFSTVIILSSPLRRVAIKVAPLVLCCMFCLLLL